MEAKNSDFDLLEKARKGDHKAYRSIVRRYEGRVAATVINMLGRTPEAEDVGQETFIRFFKAMEQFRQESGLGTYLTRIAINLSLNEIKKQKRVRGFFSMLLNERCVHQTQMGTNYEKKDENEEVQRAVLKLKPKYRSVIVLRLIDGLSTRETAETLGIPVGTVLSRLTRAQNELKKILKPLDMGVEYAR